MLERVHCLVGPVFALTIVACGTGDDDFDDTDQLDELNDLAGGKADGATWESIGNGVVYQRVNAGNAIVIAYGGYTARLVHSASWATELVNEKLGAEGVGHIYAVKGPAQASYAAREIGNSKLRAHLATLAEDPFVDPLDGPDGIAGTADDRNPGADGVLGTADDPPAAAGPDGIAGTTDDVSFEGPDGVAGTDDDVANPDGPDGVPGTADDVPLAIDPATAPIYVVAHSSGSFVAHELLQQLHTTGNTETLARIAYANLDGGGSGLTRTIVEEVGRVAFVYAKDPTLNRGLSQNSSTAIALGMAYAPHASTFAVTVPNTGCVSGAGWCLHDVVITHRPHNPNMFDVAADYSDFVGRPVTTEYLDPFLE